MLLCFMLPWTLSMFIIVHSHLKDNFPLKGKVGGVVGEVLVNVNKILHLFFFN